MVTNIVEAVCGAFGTASLVLGVVLNVRDRSATTAIQHKLRAMYVESAAGNGLAVGLFGLTAMLQAITGVGVVVRVLTTAAIVVAAVCMSIESMIFRRNARRKVRVLQHELVEARDLQTML